MATFITIINYNRKTFIVKTTEKRQMAFFFGGGRVIFAFVIIIYFVHLSYNDLGQ